jgi:Protein tyrosine and serine/threonine kinase
MLGKGQKLGVYPVKDIFVVGEGFGCYLSEDPFFKSKVLLNVYRIDYLSNDQQSCLKKKLDQLFQLDHPGIVPAIDSGYENGCFYFTTQYYAQDSFKQRVLDGPSVAETKKLFQYLAQALEYAESCGHFHGTIATDDIVFDEDGDVKLLNFGMLQCFDFDRTKPASPNEKISESLSSLGQHIQTFLSDRRKSVDDSLNEIIDRCLCRKGELYQSFKTLVDDLDQLVIGNDDLDMADNVRPGSAMQKVGGATITISEEQRTQILPHVRELISEKNRVQADFDAFKLEHEKVQLDLDNALQDTESLAQRLHLVTRFDREQERKKLIASVFTGVVIGLLLTTSSFYFFNSVKTSETIENNIVYEMKAEPALKQAMIAPVKLPESQKELQPISKVLVAIEVVETPEKDVSVDQRKQTARSVVDRGKSLFNVSTAQAEGVIIFDESDRNAIEQTMTDWSEFWARQDLDQYFSYYSDSFQPADGMDVEVWKKTRRSRLKRPDWIEVGVSEVKIVPMSRQRARVLFQQHYRSDRYEDDSYKELILINEGGNWRILHEKSLEI